MYYIPCKCLTLDYSGSLTMRSHNVLLLLLRYSLLVYRPVLTSIYYRRR